MGHDTEHEQPVHIAWQLLNWPISIETLANMGLRPENDDGSGPPVTRSSRKQRNPDQLIEEAPPR
jgi:hypothetical protein